MHSAKRWGVSLILVISIVITACDPSSAYDWSYPSQFAVGVGGITLQTTPCVGVSGPTPPPAIPTPTQQPTLTSVPAPTPRPIPTSTPIPPPTSTPIPPPTSTPTPTLPPPNCPGGYYCIDDASLAYFGSWRHDTGLGGPYYNGTQSFTGPYFGGRAGDYAQVTFNGSQILYYAIVDNHHGIATLLLDGSYQYTVDLYRNVRQPFTLVWSSPQLASGTHTLNIIYTNTKDGASSGTVITIDAFAVRP